MNKKNIIICTLILALIVIFVTVIYVCIINNNKYNGVKINEENKPPLEISILKDGLEIGKTIGAVLSWKNDSSVVTSTLVPANVVLKDKKKLENLKPGDFVTLVTEKFDETYIGKIYEISYNAIDDDGNYILPVDELIDFTSKEIQVPILRENLNQTLNYYVTVRIEDKGTIIYFFKV